MGLASIVTSVIAIADRVTADLQPSITHAAWISSGGTYGEPLYASPVSRAAIVEMMQRMYRFTDGQGVEREVLQKASITILRPVSPNGATGRREPIDIRDKITLPDGYTGPIHHVEGLDSRLTNAPYMLVVILG